MDCVHDWVWTKRQCKVCIGKKGWYDDDWSREPDRWGVYPKIWVTCDTCDENGEIESRPLVCTNCGAEK